MPGPVLVYASAAQKSSAKHVRRKHFRGRAAFPGRTPYIGRRKCGVGRCVRQARGEAVGRRPWGLVGRTLGSRTGDRVSGCEACLSVTSTKPFYLSLPSGGLLCRQT